MPTTILYSNSEDFDVEYGDLLLIFDRFALG